MTVTGERYDATLDGLADMQRHRDQWREYAYGKREKPTDWLDGNKVNRPKTLIEQQRDEIERLRAELESWKTYPY
jgi:hypothetical protein